MRETKVFGSAMKTVSLDEFFAHLEAAENEDAPEAVYKAVAWVFRCLNIRCNALADVPYQILKGKTEVEWFPMRKLLWDTEAALLMWGASYWLKRGQGKAPQWLNPSSMRAKTSSKGIEYFEQNVGGKITKYKPDQIVYFRSWNPTDDLGPGVAPAQVALEAAGLAKNANLWASKFFEHGAIPAVILEAEGYIDPAEAARVEGVWQSFVGGVKNAFRTLALGQGMTAKVVGSQVKDVAMPELMEQVRSQIAVAFGIPQTLLEDAANYATAKEHRKSLYVETVIPSGRVMQETMNAQLFAADGLEFAFLFDGLEIMQEEEKDRSEAVLNLVQAGMRLDTALAVLGMDVPEGFSIEPVAVPVQVATAQVRDWSGELKKWQTKALRRLKETKSAACDFASDAIPSTVVYALQTRLEAATSPEEVKAAFAASFQNESEMGGGY